MLKPFYERGGIRLFFADCRDVLPYLPAESVDLIVTDPPYGVEYQGRRRLASAMFDKIAGDESQAVAIEGIEAAWPALRCRRHAYAFGPVGFDFKDASRPVELIWDKGMMGMGDISLPWGPSHEPINFAVKIRPSEKERESAPARIRKGSVLRYDRPNAAAVTLHPTEKPVALLRELIESSSRSGEVVLDFFAGSCRTGDAALFASRGAILIEIEEKYCEQAARRFDRILDIWQDSLFMDLEPSASKEYSDRG